MKQHNKANNRRTQQGRTLIEVMVAMVIGIVVIGSIMSTVITTSTSSRTQDSLGKLSEDAQIALNLVAGHLRMAGYSRPRMNVSPGVQATNYNGAAIRACDGPIDDLTQPLDLFVCTANNLPNSFSVVYEADLTNTWPSQNGIPTDCLGQELVQLVSPFGGNYFVAENRFFIRLGGNGEPELACAGSGGVGFGTPQTIIQNVEDMRLIFGTAELVPNPDGTLVPGNRVSRYLRPDEIDGSWPAEPVMDRWLRARSARICLLMRTGDFVTDAPTPYTDCTGTIVTPADRRLRIAVSTTINLRTVPGTTMTKPLEIRVTRTTSSLRKQEGVALAIALILMAVIGLSSVTAIQSGIFGTLVAGNLRSSQLAVQAAEMALRYCDRGARQFPATVPIQAVPAANIDTPVAWQAAASWADPAMVFTLPDAIVNSPKSAIRYNQAPQCLVESLELRKAKGGYDEVAFVVTARGFSPDYRVDGAGVVVGGSEVWLQSIVRYTP